MAHSCLVFAKQLFQGSEQSTLCFPCASALKVDEIHRVFGMSEAFDREFTARTSASSFLAR